MLFTIENIAFAQAVLAASNATSAGEYSNLTIQVNSENELKITGIRGSEANQLRIGSLANAEVHEAGTCAVDALDLGPIARILPKGGTLTFHCSAQSREAVLETGNSRFTLVTKDVGTFQDIDISYDENNAEDISGDLLTKAINAVLPAVRTDAGMDHFHNIHIRKESDRLRFAASDGARLHVQWIPSDITLPSSENSAHEEFSLPPHLAREMTRISAKHDVRLNVEKRYLYLTNEETYIRSPLVDTMFPNLDPLLQNAPNFIDIDRNVLKNALTRVRAGLDRANNRAPVLILKLSQDTLTLEVENNKKSAKESISVDSRGQTLHIGVNAHLFASGIDISSSTNLRLGFTSQNAAHPLHMTDGAEHPDHHVTLSPLRINTAQ